MPTERQLVDAYTRRALLLLRVSAGIESDAVARLRALAAELRAILAGYDLTTLGKRELKALLRRTEDAISRAYAEVANHAADSVGEVGGHEQAWAAAALGAAVAPRATYSAASLLVLGLPLARHWARQRDNLSDRVAATVRVAASTGITTEDAVRSIVGAGRRGRERGGLMEGARQQAVTVMNTAVRAGAEDARHAAWEAAGVRYLKWHSILDTRTTVGCAVRAGKIYTLDLQPVGHDIPVGVPPPAHFNCRSILVPMAPDFQPPGDGQDPYTESLDDWLKRQPENAQDELLGPARAALWRAGKISARDLLGRGGEVLRITDLARGLPDDAKVMLWTGEANYKRLAGELTPAMREAGDAAGLTEAHMVAIRHYSGDGYEALNKALREGRDGRSTVAAGVLNEALERLPAYTGTVVRRTTLPDDVLAKYVPGNVVTEDAFTSATKNLDRDVMRRKPHRLIIESRAGKYVAPWSAAAWQEEVLFGYPRRFEVRGRQERDGAIWIWLAEATQ